MPEGPSSEPGKSKIQRSRLRSGKPAPESTSSPRPPRPPRSANAGSAAPRGPRPPARGPARGTGPRPGGPRPGASGGTAASSRPHRSSSPRLTELYKDDLLIAVEKPAGMEVRGQDEAISVIEAVRRQTRVRRASHGPWSVHQIETAATGVCVLARTPAARDDLLQSRRTEKFYLALVEGDPAEPDAPGNGTISTEQKGREMGELRQLVTHYQRLGVHDGRALLRLRPRTDGRGQLQSHLRMLNARVVSGPDGRLGVHLAEIVLTHPQTHERLRIQSPAPDWMYTMAGLKTPSGAEPHPAEPGAGGDGWDKVADWYAEYVGSPRNDLLDAVVNPGVQRLLGAQPDQVVLDVACGEGALARLLSEDGVRVLGIDASEKLIARAQERASHDTRFLVADARTLARNAEIPQVDHACCVLALMNIDPIEPVLDGMKSHVRPGGRVVIVVLHPAFRSPRRSSWAWEGKDSRTQRQHRRVDAYLSEQAITIVMNPGQVASGAPAVTTTTFVRPMQAYVNAMGRAGLLVDSMEEWTSPRVSEPGPRADEENRARREFPMFLAIRAVRPLTDSAR
ncbi:MAG: methyltransferase domain-containing protein [Leptolyngbya sp. PLA3]|nr:MAG: methyltransferase domain-containing protein [Cyanobacteria bacterium CYA]MCE7967566.1 methyltransferase domain-containing protein [Leptolyngbya sp. PL-A3]